MSAETVLSTLARPLLEEFSQGIETQLPDVTTSLEQAASDQFPTSLFLTLKRPNTEPVVVEVALHVRAARDTLSAEVLSEAGTVLGPALVGRLAKEPEPGRERHVAEFVKRLGFFLQASLEPVVEALGGQLLQTSEWESQILAEHDAYSREEARLPTQYMPSYSRQEARAEFIEAARSRLSAELGRDLAPAKIPLLSGAVISFELTSQGHDVVGHIQWDYYGKLPRSRISELVWQLEKVPNASRRLLVVGPSRNTLDRWIERFGRSSAGDIQFWHLYNGQLKQVLTR